MDKLKEPFFHDYKQKQDKKIDETRKSDNLFLKNCRFVNKLKSHDECDFFFIKTRDFMYT